METHTRMMVGPTLMARGLNTEAARQALEQSLLGRFLFLDEQLAHCFDIAVLTVRVLGSAIDVLHLRLPSR
jgi:hypothetical protein